MSIPAVSGAPEGAIAIVGMACRFPGARNVGEFWRNLENGVESIRRLTDGEVEPPQLGPDPRSSPDYVRAAATIDDVESFDAQFFAYSPMEASLMDPQQRLLLECAWEALEDAGYDSERYDGTIGVFAGSRSNTYLINLIGNRGIVRDIDAIEIGLGNDLGFLASRLSHRLNLRGPSCAVHTACSTSLVAVHMACESLLVGECSMALAGGVSVLVPHRAGYLHRPGAMLSPDGHCRAFSADAAGTVFGNGVGLVVLKRYEDAVGDKDTIHALVRGTAVNNDGARKASFTAPGIDGQTTVVLDALATAGVPAATIGYIEAHGTGTALGDPIEIRALTKAFRAETDRRHFCAIGSVKTNIGHLDAAAGIAGLIKTALALEHRFIPPSLHCETPSPHIDFAATPFFVNTEGRVWEADGPRRAGVSSFGVGGTNAHAILEEAPPRPAVEPSEDSRLLVISARTPQALKQRATALAVHLREESARLADVAHTLARGRRHFAHRWSTVSDGRAEAARAFAEFAAAPVEAGDNVDSRDVAFMFPGQGAQHAGMGARIYEAEPVFRQQVDRCAAVLDPLIGCDLRELMFTGALRGVESKAAMNETRFAQPALFTIELALARLWVHWGVAPAAMLGHSIGEYVAACLAGVLSDEDALRLVAIRGEMMQRLPGGAMLAVSLSEAQLRPFLVEGVDLAAVNASNSCVLSGSHEAIAAVESRLTSQGALTRRLAVSHAFHSRAMDGILDEFAAVVARTPRHRPTMPYLSNLTGTWITAEDVTDPGYWARHLRHTVRFADGLSRLVGERARVLLEVGPVATLTPLCRRAAASARFRHVVLTCLDENAGRGAEALKRTLGRVWEARVDCDWSRIDTDATARRVPLPTYPFERQRYWIEPDRGAEVGAAPERLPNPADWYYALSWQSAEGAGGDVRPGTVLVFADAAGVAAALAHRLDATSRADQVVVVREGEAFARTGPNEYVVDPARSEHYDALLRACATNHCSPITHVAHLWSLFGAGGSLRERVAAARVRSFGSLVSLARAWASNMRSAPLSVMVATSGVYDVTREEPINAEQSLVEGPCRVIPQEMPNVRCRHVDLALPSPTPPSTTIAVEQLARELTATGDDTVVCYRHRRRWIQTFERRAIEAGAGAVLRRGGVYLITGGLGGVGAIVAEHLARTLAAKCVLLARTELPPRETWPVALAEAEDPERRARIERVLRIEHAGGTVLPVAGDVADPADLAAALDLAKRHFGALHGVFHAAAVAGGGLVRLKTASQADAVLRPKVDGLVAIEEVFRSEPLDFIVLFSSISAILGELGQVDYCAANAFLDACARRASHEARRVVSVNWDTWREDGLSRAALRNELPAVARARIESELRNGLSSAEGCHTLDSILDSSFRGQVIVSTRGIHGRLADVRALASSLVGDADSGVAHRESVGASSQRGSAATTERVAAVMAAVLGAPTVAPEDNFFDLGGHSLLATRLIARLGEELGVEISLRAFLESPTVADLAAHVDALLGQEPRPAAVAAESEPVAGPRG